MPYRIITRANGGAIKGASRAFTCIDDLVRAETAQLTASVFAELFPAGQIRYSTRYHPKAQFLGCVHKGIPDGATTLVVAIRGYGEIECARYGEDKAAPVQAHDPAESMGAAS